MMQSQQPVEPAKQSPTAPSAAVGFAGLVIDSLDTGQDTLTIDGSLITVRRNWQTSSDETIGSLELIFGMEKPARFGVTLKIPDDCQNACMTLNNQSLLGWFSEIFPENMMLVPVSPCADPADHVTPLRPGRLQILNFRWLDGDRLKMIVVLG